MHQHLITCSVLTCTLRSWSFSLFPIISIYSAPDFRFNLLPTFWFASTVCHKINNQLYPDNIYEVNIFRSGKTHQLHYSQTLCWWVVYPSINRKMRCTCTTFKHAWIMTLLVYHYGKACTDRFVTGFINHSRRVHMHFTHCLSQDVFTNSNMAMQILDLVQCVYW